MAVDSLRARTPIARRLLDEQGRPRVLNRLEGIHLSGLAVAALVLALTGLSVLLRTGQLHFHFWVDEGISVGIASHPLSQLPHLLREDGSPPLYYFLLHVWMQLFGRSVVATHELSLVFGLITVPVAYWAGSSLFGRTTGAVATITAATLPFITQYSQETRMYTLLLLFSLIVSASFVHAFVFRRRRYLALFALSLAGTVYTHNWGLFFGLFAFVAFLVRVWRSPPEMRRGLWIDGLIGFGVAALLYLPWVPTLLYQVKHTGAPWALPPVLWSLTQGGYFIVGGRGPAVALLFGAGAGLWALRTTGPEDRVNRQAAIALAILGLGTVLFAWAYAKTTPAWAFRYLAVIVGPLILLFSFGVTRGGRLGLIGFVMACAFFVTNPITPHVDAKSNVASVTAAVRPALGSHGFVFSTQPEQVPVLAYYMPAGTRFATPLGRVTDPRVMDWRNALEKFSHASLRTTLIPMLQTLKPGDRLALVIPHHFTTAPDWMVYIQRNSEDALAYLQHDRQLKLLATSAANAAYSGLPLQASVYEVR